MKDVADELQDIKKLLVLYLIKQGVAKDSIAFVLQTTDEDLVDLGLAPAGATP